jgi:hypothetical protein
MDQKKTSQTPRIRVGRLKSAQDVAKYQARLIKRASRPGGGIGVAVNECYKLCVMASMLAKTLETSELEKRIGALEQSSNKKGL